LHIFVYFDGTSSFFFIMYTLMKDKKSLKTYDLFFSWRNTNEFVLISLTNQENI